MINGFSAVAWWTGKQRRFERIENDQFTGVKAEEGDGDA